MPEDEVKRSAAETDGRLVNQIVTDPCEVREHDPPLSGEQDPTMHPHTAINAGRLPGSKPIAWLWWAGAGLLGLAIWALLLATVF